MALHNKAIQARDQQFHTEVKNWEVETRQQYGDQLAGVVGEIQRAIGTDSDAQRFVQLMEYYGLGNNISVLRVLHRLATSGGR